MAAFSYNNKINVSTGFSPFYINKGYHPDTGINLHREVKSESAAEFATQMEKIREEAQAALKTAQETMKRYYDRTRGESREYKVGDKVWLEGHHIQTDRPMKKLEDKRYGPFRIVEKVGKSAYRLQLPKTWKALHPVFNEVVLSPYVEPAFPSQIKPAPSPPEIVNGTEEYVVEELMDSKLSRGVLKYLVKWKGWPREAWTWETRDNLMKHAKSAVNTFHRKHPNAPRPKPANMRFVKFENVTEPTNIPAYLFNWESGVFERTERIARTQSLEGG